MLSPDETLIIGIPMELEMLLVLKVGRERELNFKPVGGPAGAEGGAKFSGFKYLGRCLFKGWTSGVWG